MKIRLHGFISEMEGKTITFKGYGYQDKVMSLKDEGEPIPTFNRCEEKYMPKAFFSTEEINFGEVSKGEVSTRMVILFNRSTTSSLMFNFKGTSLTL